MSQDIITVAIVDDHTIFRKAMIELINSFTNTKVVMDAINGKAFVENLEKMETLPNVCIVDINMSVQNGYETTAILKERWPEMKIIALSMINEEFSVIKMLRNGANSYIVKDCDPIDLYNAISGVHKNQYYHTEMVTSKIIHNITHNNKANIITEKEMELLKYICSDLTYKQIAEKMFVSPRTIDDYRDSLHAKLNVKSRTALALFALRMGFCTDN